MNIFVKTTYANIYDKPTFSSSMVTQALFWEKLEVLSSKGSWFKVKQWDGYEGWVHSFYIQIEGDVERYTSDAIVENNLSQTNILSVKQPILRP